MGKRWQTGDLAAALHDFHNIRADRQRDPPIAEYLTGTVLFYDAGKGWGFICPDDGRQADNVFVHVSAVSAASIISLTKGDRVEFEIGMSPTGKPEAKRLRKLEPTE